MPRVSNTLTSTLSAALLVFGCVICASGCAHHPPKRRVGVPIDSRPTPAQTEKTAGPPDTTASGQQITPSPRTVRTASARVAADTTAARAALDRCAGKKLLPDQEGVFDSTRSLLAEVRAALQRSDLARAESLARQARQLSSSLACR